MLRVPSGRLRERPRAPGRLHSSQPTKWYKWTPDIGLFYLR
ncbi:hypothetical protein Anas_10679 [Armadillidium nasatum]|uniref:Uncharacterized protein n=1 Tax=Armadillidium nasatum TaxID=96803 RepID=A0A5N5SP27_9CRUS|nr:hypothetical protein Anas_10679 [Armadillidium nasatum]